MEGGGGGGGGVALTIDRCITTMHYMYSLLTVVGRSEGRATPK